MTTIPDVSHLLSPRARPLVFVLSGLSGAGKDAVLTRLKESGYPLQFIVTATTRDRRASEKNGVHYTFVSREEFQKLIEREELLEWANVYGNWYGVPKEPVRRALESGRDVIVKVDVQGAATIKKILPQAVFIFLAPPSVEELVLRLKQRSTESPSDLDLRIAAVRKELEKLPLFDYIILNQQGEVDRAVADLGAIITAEKCRVTPREMAL